MFGFWEIKYNVCGMPLYWSKSEIEDSFNLSITQVPRQDAYRKRKEESKKRSKRDTYGKRKERKKRSQRRMLPHQDEGEREKAVPT